MKGKACAFFAALGTLAAIQGMFVLSAHAAVVTGKVNLEGTPPAPEKVSMDADPVCLTLHTEPVYTNEVVANPDGTLQNVFVYVKEGLEGKTFDPPREKVVFDQQECMYTPHVVGIRVNQDLEIINSDDTLHNVHALPEKSPQFNLGMPVKGMKIAKKFTAPEVMVKVKCEVHPWMRGYIGVLDHPFFGVSSSSGSFEIKDLPAGTYTIEAWHEKYGTLTQSVTVGEGETKEISFSFKGA